MILVLRVVLVVVLLTQVREVVQHQVREMWVETVLPGKEPEEVELVLWGEILLVLTLLVPVVPDYLLP